MNRKLSFSLLLSVLLLLVLTAVFADEQGTDIAPKSGVFDLLLNFLYNSSPTVIAGLVVMFLAYFVPSACIKIGATAPQMVILSLIILGYPIILFVIDFGLRRIPMARFPNGAVLMDRLSFNKIDLVFVVALEFLLGCGVHAILGKAFYFVYLVGWIVADVIGLYAGAWTRFVLSCAWPVISLISMALSYSENHDMVGVMLLPLEKLKIVPAGWITEMARENRVINDGADARGRVGVARCVLAYIVPVLYPVYYFFHYEGQRSLLLGFLEYYSQQTLMALPSAEAVKAGNIVDDESPSEQLRSPSLPLPSPTNPGSAASSTPPLAPSRLPEKKGAVKDTFKRLEKDLDVGNASTMTSGLCALVISTVLLLAV